MDVHPGPEKRRLSEVKPTEFEPILRALRENEDWYQDLVEHSQALLCIHDLTGRLLSVNPVPARLLGYTVEEIRQIPMRKLIAPEFRSQFDTYLEQIERAGEAHGFLVVITRSGERRIWEYHNTLRTEGVALPIVRGIAHDVTEQRETEKLLREVSERLLSRVCESERTIQELRLFRTLVDQSNDAIEVVDPETLRFLDANEKACSALGYSREELLSLRVFDINPAVTEISAATVIAELKKTGFMVMESVHRRKDGSTFPVEVSMKRVQLEREYVVAIAHDLTERKQTEARLREYERVVEGLEEMIAVVDRDYHYVIANREFLRPRGLEKQQLMGRTVMEQLISEGMSKEAVARVKEKMDECFQGKIVQYELTYQYPLLGHRDLFLSYFPIEGPTGVDRIACVLQDVTEQKRSEQALRDAKEFSENLIRTANVIVLCLDTGGNIKLFNQAAEEITGYTFSELEGKNWSILAPRDRFPHVWEEFDRVVAGTAAPTFENPIITKSGEERYIAWRNSQVKVDGKIVATISFGNDITERKQAEEALQRSEENYRMFVSQSSEGIFREEMDAPVSIDLPEDELIHHILHDSYMAECNDTLARMYGLTSGQEFVGKRLTEVLPPEDPRNIELTRNYIRSGFRVLDRESHELDIHGNPKVFANSMIGTVENGMLVRTWGIQRDITERVKLEEARRKAEEALRQSEHRFRVALSGSPIKVFNQDRDLRYTWVYNMQEGWTEQDYLGKTDEEIFEPEGAAEMTALKRLVLERGKGAREELTLTARGKTYHCDITVEPLFDAAGQIVGVNCAYVDVTHLREISEELRLAKEKLAEEKLYLEEAIDNELGFGEIIGRSSALKEVMAKVAKVAPSDATVLLLGETGTGKELVARALHHRASARAIASSS